MPEIKTYNHNGTQTDLKGSPFDEGGGEGKIYEIIGKPKLCAKIYKPQKITNELHDKIKVMIENPPEDPMMPHHRSITWPIDILYEDIKKTKFIGFTMPFINRDIFRESHEYFDNYDRIKEFGGEFTWLHMFTAAYNIASAVAYIHEKGHCVGDLREKNILVAKNGLITLIDCDSFQVKNNKTGKIFYTKVGFDEYLPPELISVNFENKNYDRYFSDLFALGILIFKFLMMGTHPFQAKGPLVNGAGSTNAKIKKGFFPYINIKGVKPPDHAPPYDIIPPNISKLFYRCFVLGHKDPKKRPIAKEWLDVLRREIGQ